MLRKYLISVIFITIVACFAIGAGFVLAAADDNVSGWAWSSNIGWISFNSTNCDTDDNGTSNGGIDCPAAGTAMAKYGVNIDLANNGLMSGYAWSSNIGWITFNASQLSGCPSGTCEAGFNSGTGKVTGWARAYRAIVPEGQSLGGWDGWIKLDVSTGNLRIDTSAGSPYEFYGWASSRANDPESSVIGWVSFNGDNPEAPGGADYQVKLNEAINQPSEARNLSVVPGDYCSVSSHRFSWLYFDADNDRETQYQFQIDNNSDFSSPEVNKTVPADQASGTMNTQSVIVSASPGLGQISFSPNPYYWRVQVWDEQGAGSGWVNGPSFSTWKHVWPTVSFAWSPAEPVAEEDVLFTNNSVCYDIDNNPSSAFCTGKAGVACGSGWCWTFQDANPTNSVQQNPVVQFFSGGSNEQVVLTATDADGYSCSKTQIINVAIPFPEWREITPR